MSSGTRGDHQRLKANGQASVPESALAVYLANRDEPCPACNYNVRGLTNPWCPECGQELRLQLALAHPRLAWFMAGLVGLAFPCGFYVTLCCIGIIELLIEDNPGLRTVAMIYVAAAIPVALALIGGWIKLRRRFSSARALVRWGLAGGCWILLPLQIALMYLVLELLVPV